MENSNLTLTFSFNFNKVGISVSGYFQKSEASFNSFQKARQISVMDPQDETNDLTRASFGWSTIRYEFMRAFDLLQSYFGAAYVRKGNLYFKTLSIILFYLSLNAIYPNQNDILFELY